MPGLIGGIGSWTGVSKFRTRSVFAERERGFRPIGASDGSETDTGVSVLKAQVADGQEAQTRLFTGRYLRHLGDPLPWPGRPRRASSQGTLSGGNRSGFELSLFPEVLFQNAANPLGIRLIAASALSLFGRSSKPGFHYVYGSLELPPRSETWNLL